MRILIIDYNSQLNVHIEKKLKTIDMKVSQVTFDIFSENLIDITHFDLIVLDTPETNQQSCDAVKQIRFMAKNIPIIILSTFKKIENISKCIISGCNDYLKKPIHIDELIIKIKFWLNYEKLHEHKKINLINGFTFDTNTFQLLQNKIPISLTSKEQLFIEILLQNRGWFVPVSTIIQYVWDEPTDPNNLRVLLYKLRKKLDYELIISMKGVGYKIEELGI